MFDNCSKSNNNNNNNNKKIIDPYLVTKESKELIKHAGASLPPSRDHILDHEHEQRHQYGPPSEPASASASASASATGFCFTRDRYFCVLLLNRKRTWMWLSEKKLRPFCAENDRLFLENTNYLSGKYRKELEKAYKKAKKLVEKHISSNN